MLVGGALIVTGVGGPLGMALVSAGVDTIVQKATTGDVNWGQVAVSGVIGGATAGLGAYTSSAVRTGAMTTSRALAVNVGGNATIGGVGNTASYLVGNDPDKTWRGATGAFAGGLVSGAASGGTGALGVPGAHAGAATLPVTLGREAPRFLLDAGGGFGGQVTQDLVSGNDVAWDQAGIKAAGYGVAGSSSRGLNHYVPEQVGVHGLHQAGPAAGLPRRLRRRGLLLRGAGRDGPVRRDAVGAR